MPRPKGSRNLPKTQLIEKMGMIMAALEPNRYRELLSVLPIPGIRLLVRMQAEMSMKPGYSQVPQSEYDCKDFWQVSQPCMGERRTIKLVLSKDYTEIFDRKAMYEQASSDYGRMLNKVKTARKQMDNEPEQSGSKPEYAKVLAKYEAELSAAKQILDDNAGIDFQETVWEIPFEECV